MKVAVLGTGSIGLGYAALLHQAGHRPVLWSPSGQGTAPFADGAELVASNALELRFAPEIATDPAFVGEADAAIVTVPGYGYSWVFKAVLPHLKPGRPVIVSAHLSLAALYLRDRLAERGVTAPVLAWSTTVLMGRKTGPASVSVGAIRQEVDLAAADPQDGPAGLALCEALFGARFRLRGDILAIQLGNLNPPVHMANVLCNLTRIERSEDWGNYDGITPAVARLIEALDLERLALAAACGVEVRSVAQHYRLSFGLPEGMSVAEMAAAAHRLRRVAGPKTLETRFVTEDIPFGIVPLARMGRALGVPVPLHEAGAAMLGAIYGRDFEAENDIFAFTPPTGRR